MITQKYFVKNIKLFFAVAAILILSAGISQAAIYYVSPAGSAAWGDATNINTPTDVGTAFKNAQADDTVYFRGGTYVVPPKNFSNTYHGYYEPANSGAAGKPITFAAYPGETPLFNGTVGGSGDDMGGGYYAATIFGTNNRSYIIFDGFSFMANNGVNMARIMIGTDYDGASNIILRNCRINGGTTRIPVKDNYECIRIEKANDVLIRGCTVFNARSDDDTLGRSGLKSYASNRVTVENNEFYNCEEAIYPKSSNDSWIIRYNWIHDCKVGIYITPYITAAAHNQDNHQIYHNVIANTWYSAIHIYGETGSHSDNIKVYNNTVYSPLAGTLGIFLGTNGQNVVAYNNIVQGAAGNQITFAYGNNYTLAESDYNQWGTSSLGIQTHLYGSSSRSYTSIASWQASTDLIGGGHPGTGDLASNPLFVNSSGKYARPSDFNLQAGSPCKGTGKGGVDMGANVDLVGVGTGRKAIAAPPNAR